MTQNQIAWQNLLENRRSHRATEDIQTRDVAEKERSNRAKEAISIDTLGETRRSNLAKEQETFRHNAATETETARANRNQEKWRKDTLIETKRDNVQRALDRWDQNETNRRGQDMSYGIGMNDQAYKRWSTTMNNATARANKGLDLVGSLLQTLGKAIG